MKARRRSGVSAVIGVLLLIAVSISLSVALFAWSTSFLAGLAGQGQAEQPLQNQATLSAIVLENVKSQGYVQGSSNATLYVYVRNVGDYSPLVIGSVTIQGLSTNIGFKGSLVSTWSGSSFSSVPGVTLCVASISAADCSSPLSSASLQKLGTAKLVILWQSGSGAPVTGDTLTIRITTTTGSSALQTVELT